LFIYNHILDISDTVDLLQNGRPYTLYCTISDSDLIAPHADGQKRLKPAALNALTQVQHVGQKMGARASLPPESTYD